MKLVSTANVLEGGWSQIDLHSFGTDLAMQFLVTVEEKAFVDSTTQSQPGTLVQKMLLDAASRGAS